MKCKSTRRYVSKTQYIDLGTNVFYLSDRNRRKGLEKSWLCTTNCYLVWVHRTVSGVPDWLPANWPLSGKLRQCTTIIHRTVWWCTGLSGEPTAASTTVDRRIRGRHVARSNGRQGHRTVRCAPDSVRCANFHQSAIVDCARFGRESGTGHEQ
jgi:hypothetical protein